MAQDNRARGDGAGRGDQRLREAESMEKIAPHLPGPEELPGRTSLLGQPAPEFRMKDEEGNFVTLRRLVRQRPILLHLYRGAW